MHTPSRPFVRTVSSTSSSYTFTHPPPFQADILADRKAILSKGRVQCVGSSLFLKSRFGVGYHLNISLNSSRRKMNLQS